MDISPAEMSPENLNQSDLPPNVLNLIASLEVSSLQEKVFRSVPADDLTQRDISSTDMSPQHLSQSNLPPDVLELIASLDSSSVHEDVLRSVPAINIRQTEGTPTELTPELLKFIASLNTMSENQ